MECSQKFACIGDALTCSICQQFFQDPVMLGCCHNFCRGCLSSTNDARSSLIVEECPLCKKKIDIKANDLKGNSVLNEIVTLMKGNQKRVHGITSKPICQLCYSLINSSNGFKCVECNIAYCSVCREKYHPSIGILSHHQIEHVREENINEANKKAECQIHKKDIVYFCLQCRQAICFDCHNESHKDHKGDMLSKAFSDERDTLSPKIENTNSLLEKCTQQLESQRQQLPSLRTLQTNRISHIRENFDSLRHALDEKEKELLGAEEKVVGEPLNKYEKGLKEIESSMSCLRSVLSLAEVVVQEGEAIPLLMMSKPILTGIDQHSSPLNKDITTEAPKIADDQVKIEIGQVKEKITHLGDAPCVVTDEASMIPLDPSCLPRQEG